MSLGSGKRAREKALAAAFGGVIFMKRGIVLVALFSAGCLLTGCSSFSPEVTGVSVSKNGTITQVVRENFGEAYYSDEELKNVIDNEVEAYNSANGEKSVRKKRLKIKDQTAELTMSYASYEDYAKFNSIGFYVGDINGAIQAGFAFEGSFYPVSEGKSLENTVWGSSLMSGKNYKTIVITEALLVEVPGTIAYVSDNVKVTGKSEAVTEEAGTAYILYE